MRRKPKTKRRTSEEVLGQYLSATELKLRLSGHWRTGGWLELYFEGQLLDQIEYSAAQWSLLAKLFLAAIFSQSTHWSNAFVTAKAIAQELKAQGVLKDPGTNEIYKLVNAVRSPLAKTTVRKLMDELKKSGKAWEKRLVENSKGRGYRIGLPPKSLDLFLGERHYGGGVSLSVNKPR